MTKHGLSAEVRFWMKVDKSGSCWIWTASTQPGGYGQLRIDGRTVRAPRFAWELENGPIPSGLHVCHRCDNPSCVRASHLFLGTRSDNMQDAVAKRRHRHFVASGESHPSAKVTDVQVVEIRKRRASGGIYRDIADEFGISISQVARIVKGASRIDADGKVA